MRLPDAGLLAIFPGSRLDVAVTAFTNSGTLAVGVQGLLTIGAVQGVATLLFSDGTLDGVTYAGPLNAVAGSTID